MGIEIVLELQIGLIVFPHVVVNERDGYNERDITLAIVVDDLQQFLFFVAGKVFLEIPHQMLQDIDLLLDRRP